MPFFGLPTVQIHKFKLRHFPFSSAILMQNFKNLTSKFVHSQFDQETFESFERTAKDDGCAQMSLNFDIYSLTTVSNIVLQIEPDKI